MIRQSRFSAARWMTVLSWANFVGVWIVIALIHGVSERWWISMLVLYLPRSPWMLPALILLPLSLRFHWKSGFVNLASVLLVLGPVMNWQCGGLVAPKVDRATPKMTVVSCNVQSFRPDFGKVVLEINRINPDLILFQEAFEDHALLKTLLEGWNVHREDEYLTASRWPLTFLGKCEVGAMVRTTVVRYSLETPSGKLFVCNVHQISPRHALTNLRPWSIITGSGVEDVAQAAILRDVEALKAREFTQTQGNRQPTLIAGDFNMPNDSSLFRKHWGDLTDAFATTAVGYGYTSPCKKTGWPSNTPWAQVDHILTTPEMPVERCSIGSTAGSDHRLITAQFRLPKKIFSE
ncbi:MAG: Endonuclease/Exonuclease/phosphatase family protein [Planctomycetaceae bacterium]|nr:Endonuclease/Exonuclease/phosphatase family protein [Planctomycetaceae bacterium]